MKPMKLTPIERPQTLFLKLAYYLSKRRFGKVIMPLKVLYARVPALLMLSAKLESIEKKLSLPKETRILIKNFVAQLNNCEFCSDLSKYEALKNTVEGKKIFELMNYKDSATFNEQEKALFAYLEEVTVMKSCSDATFLQLKKYFSEKEIVEITWLCAKEHYYNLMAKPVGIASDELAGSVVNKEETEMKTTSNLAYGAGK
jgi:AhpD family alkylhydroperoxidase